MSEIRVDTISEKTSSNGVAIDGLTIKDGGITATTGDVVFNEASADVDFRVESNGNTHMLFVDGGNDCVNIGASNDRGGLLNVEGNGGVVIRVADNNDALKLQSTDTDANAGPLLTLERSNNSAANADETGKIVFKAQNNANEAIVYSRILSQINDVTDGAEDGIISLQTIIAGTLREGMRYSDGGVVFNELSQDIDFRVESNANANMFFIDAGNEHVCIGTNAPSDGDDASFNIEGDTSKYAQKIFQGATGTQGAIRFHNPNGTVGNIHMSGSSTVFATSSDYRLKENVNYDWDATTELKKLKPAKFNWKVDTENTVEGFLAHEVSDIVPDAITGTKDEIETKTKVIRDSANQILGEGIEEADWIAGKVDGKYPSDSTWQASETKEKYQQIDQSKLVPLMVKTIQELEARIKTLEDA